VSRLHALVAHPRRTVGALAVVLAAAGITVGSGASFTAQSANPSNTFTAGTLSMTNSAGAILNATNLKPGATDSGTVDIANTGSVSGDFSVRTSSPSDSTPSLLGLLDLKILDCGVFSGTTAPDCSTPATKYTGKISAIPASIDLGSFAGGVKHRYRFEVTMPSSADDQYQGKTASISFNWNAVSN
jgi:spore coat-associated protein N